MNIVQKTCKHHGVLEQENIIIQKERIRCRLCVNKIAREWRRKNSDLVNERVAKDFKINPEKYRNYDRQNKNRNGDGRRYRDVLRKHNLSDDQYQKLVNEHDNRCAICKKKETRASRTKGKITRLAIDHCHVTGIVRGLLCHSCNIMIGKAHDSIEILQEAIKYLNKHKEVNEANIRSI